MKKLCYIMALALVFILSCSVLDKDDPAPPPPPPEPNLVLFASNFNVDGTGTFYYDGTAKAVSVTAKSDMIAGRVTVFYEGEEYPKVDVPPVYYGEYKVTFDVEASPGVDSAMGLYAGTLIIANGTPAAPSISSLKLKSSTSIEVNWGSVARAEKYKVFYITEDMEELEFLGEVTSGNSFLHENLTEGNTYFYFVTAVNSDGESEYSDFKAIKIDVPVAPANLEASATSDSQVSLRWGSVSGATGYEVYYATDLDGEKTLIPTTGTSTSATITGLTADKTYYFYIIAVNPVGKSDFSEPVSAKTMVKANWYAGIRASSSTLSSDRVLVTLTWNSYSTPSSATSAGYSVYRSTGSPDNFTLIDYTSSVPMSSSFNTYYTPNTVYYIYVEYSYANYAGAIIKGRSEIFVLTTGSYTPPAIAPTPAPSTPSTPPASASTGAKTCTTCNGDGKCHYGSVMNGQTCSSGKVQCNVCSGKGYTVEVGNSHKNCTTCSGTGKIKCPSCNGSGKCSRCGGSGKL